MSLAVEKLSKGDLSAPVRVSGETETMTVVIAGTSTEPFRDVSEHYLSTIDLLQKTITALRIVSKSSAPNFTIEKVWPIYLRLVEKVIGNYDVHQVVIVEHGWKRDRIVSADDFVAAAKLVSLAYQNSPLFLFQDFELRARTAGTVLGDYVNCILNAAIAIEVLIKQVSLMLIWELARQDWEDASYIPLVNSRDENLAGPIKLLNGVISARIEGNWNLRDKTSPAALWDSGIRDMRNRIIHTGYIPTELDVAGALAALDSFSSQLLRGVANSSNTYPITCDLFRLPSTRTELDVHQELLYEYREWTEWLLDVKLKEDRNQ